jgi:hypothetical protein
MQASDLIVPLVGAVFGFAFVLPIVRGGRFGVTLRGVHCPQCGQLQPHVRVPKSVRQAFWGGFTCAACATEMDRDGKALVAHRGA